ncbi:hypothetical protein SAMN04488498_103345 [Mesorhizobium albiziae]|uniref:Uncharacterized protein n=1 Tax=Neomesorhizobium albiziae TaxID=335020 RepID=A0A1I3XLL3_9HYPH|nr:hypothetical protein [Mesorhizobium albiziae]GLS30343.1 hypothetical protein GCM10007937_20510 [Mesorhizobium albiziae]SFK20378.1 hypothetical protein SAMN04488498_103345 [Mesorhizobium albiziae]
MARRFLSHWIKYALAAVLMATSTAVAQAQQNCGPHADLIAHLHEKYQELQVGYGTVGTIAMMEVYASAAGTWTIIVTDVAGKSCIVAAGEGWETTTAATWPDA